MLEKKHREENLKWHCKVYKEGAFAHPFANEYENGGGEGPRYDWFPLQWGSPPRMKQCGHVVFPRNNGLRNEGGGRHSRRRQRNENNRFGYDRNGQDNGRVGIKPYGERHHYNDPIRPLEGVNANDRYGYGVDQILDYLDKKYGPAFRRCYRPHV